MIERLSLGWLPLWLANLIREILTISFNLYKLMIPIIIIVKIIQELGGIKYIAMALEPFMELVGLPASMGLVWATTMITNIYGGMILFITNTPQESLTVAQVTILGGMMLIAHALPIEVRIAQKAGVRILFTLLLRIGGALLLGFLLHKIYSIGGFLTETNNALWKPQLVTDDSILAWGMSQIKTLGQVFLVISVLIIFLKLLKLSGIEKLLALLLKPLLKILGLSDKTTSISIIGITLGLTYGGGLLINEAQKGHISKADIFGSLSLLALCHSLIEDTLLIMLLGADISGVLYFRLFFSVILISLIIRLARQLNQTNFSRFLVYPE
jgi:hypothetical protein